LSPLERYAASNGTLPVRDRLLNDMLAGLSANEFASTEGLRQGALIFRPVKGGFAHAPHWTPIAYCPEANIGLAESENGNSLLAFSLEGDARAVQSRDYRPELVVYIYTIDTIVVEGVLLGRTGARACAGTCRIMR
jgi:hypothetical protein